jgi:hypothetical protein
MPFETGLTNASPFALRPWTSIRSCTRWERASEVTWAPKGAKRLFELHASRRRSCVVRAPPSAYHRLGWRMSSIGLAVTTIPRLPVNRSMSRFAFITIMSDINPLQVWAAHSGHRTRSAGSWPSPWSPPVQCHSRNGGSTLRPQQVQVSLRRSSLSQPESFISQTIIRCSPLEGLREVPPARRAGDCSAKRPSAIVSPLVSICGAIWGCRPRRMMRR